MVYAICQIYSPSEKTKVLGNKLLLKLWSLDQQKKKLLCKTFTLEEHTLRSDIFRNNKNFTWDGNARTIQKLSSAIVS